MKRHTLDLTERELRTILSAFDIARDQTINGQSGWWTSTQFVDRLYLRLRDLGNA